MHVQCRFLDNMAAVLKEQRRDRVPPSGLRILKAIETECVKVETTASTFLRRHMVIKMFNASSTVVRALRAVCCVLRWMCCVLRAGPTQCVLRAACCVLCVTVGWTRRSRSDAAAWVCAAIALATTDDGGGCASRTGTCLPCPVCCVRIRSRHV